MSVENTSSAITTLNDLLDPSLVASLDRLDLMSKKMLQGRMQGERRSRRRGQGMDFADFRPYAAGDDLRFVDWNIYGRLDRLFLKMFLEEEDLVLVVIIHIHLLVVVDIQEDKVVVDIMDGLVHMVVGQEEVHIYLHKHKILY